MTPDLEDAVRRLFEFPIGDYVYDIREREGLGWDGPRVRAFSLAVADIKFILKLHDKPEHT